MIYEGKTGEFFEVLQTSNSKHLTAIKEKRNETLKIIWFKGKENTLRIDRKEITFLENEMIFLTQFHEVDFIDDIEADVLRFNRPFYCVLDHDSEVGCKGVLFYGAAAIPRITFTNKDLEVLKLVWRLSILEFEMNDTLQLEMLQTMLKRILLLCTRVFKKQELNEVKEDSQHQLIREFNYLVEKYFRSKHSVSEYADLLFKSPKTISNTFKKLGDKSALQYIHDRIVLEARRLLWYTDKDISEIAYELGYIDIQSFSRFFKKHEGISPTDYRKNNAGKF